MKKIFKYKLDYMDHQEHIIIDIPMPAKILSVSEQNNIAVIYALVDDERETTPVDVLIVGTGYPIRDNIDTYDFIGTVKLDDGKYMWHIFYRYVKIFDKDDHEIPEVSLEHLKNEFVNRSRDVVVA